MCSRQCPECPRLKHRPKTVQGADVWRLVGELGGQWRYAPLPHGAGAVRTGYDMVAALAMARASGICERAVVELLPAIETAALNAGNENG